MSTTAASPLAHVDSAWLRMDDPTNLMVVTGVLMLDAAVPVDRIREVIERRVLQFPRFRQRVVDGVAPLAVPAWQEDGAPDLGYHLQVAELADRDDDRALEELVSALMSQPLDPERPLWQFHFVPRFREGSALIGRIHHCIGDGLALIYVMLSMSDDGPPEVPPRGGGNGNGEDESTPWDVVAKAISGTVSAGLSLPAAVFREMSALAFNPTRAAAMTEQVAAGVGALSKLLLMEPDPATALKGKLVVGKRVAWSTPIRVTSVKRIGTATGATINDVLISAVAGGLRRYLLGRGEAVGKDVNVRAVVPVNLRPIEEAHLLGNQFGLVFLPLPIGAEQPLDRLFEVRTRMNAIKRSPEAYLTFHILKAIGTAPRQIFDLVVDLFQRKATTVMTNVVGPREPIRMAGVRMRQAMFWVPCAGRLGLGISVLSYAGDVWVGVASDAQVIPDPHAILDGFYTEIEALQALAARSPGAHGPS